MSFIFNNLCIYPHLKTYNFLVQKLNRRPFEIDLKKLLTTFRPVSGPARLFSTGTGISHLPHSLVTSLLMNRTSPNTLTLCKVIFLGSLHCIFLAQKVRVCNRQSASVTNSLCLPHKLCARHSLCLSPKICVCNSQSVSVKNALCLLQMVGVWHKQSVSVTDSLCLSQKVSVGHQMFLSVTVSLCLS